MATRVKKVHKKGFSCVPKLVKNEGEVIEELTTRRRAWSLAISRNDLTDDKLENERVCCRHFVSGQAAKQWDQYVRTPGDWFVETKVQCVAEYITNNY